MVTPPNEAGAGADLYVCTMCARKHGAAMLIAVSVFLAILCLSPGWMGLELSGSTAVGFYGIATLVYAVFVVYSLTNFVSGGTWWCVLTREDLDVRVPHRWLGESFRLRVGDIRRLEKLLSRSDGDPQYFLTEATGARHRLTSNAAFEPQRVFDELLKLRPIEYVERYA